MVERICIGYKQARIREINAELKVVRASRNACLFKERELKTERNRLLNDIERETLADLNHPGYTRLLNEVAA